MEIYLSCFTMEYYMNEESFQFLNVFLSLL